MEVRHEGNLREAFGVLERLLYTKDEMKNVRRIGDNPYTRYLYHQIPNATLDRFGVNLSTFALERIHTRSDVTKKWGAWSSHTHFIISE